MKHLTIIECPVVFPGENDDAMSSLDMLPKLGITNGLESRHVRVLGARVTAVCIWKDALCAEHFFDDAWHAKASTLWEGDYRKRSDTIGSASAA